MILNCGTKTVVSIPNKAVSKVVPTYIFLDDERFEAVTVHDFLSLRVRYVAW